MSDLDTRKAYIRDQVDAYLAAIRRPIRPLDAARVVEFYLPQDVAYAADSDERRDILHRYGLSLLCREIPDLRAEYGRHLGECG